MKEKNNIQKLSPKRERFCQEYLIDLNATQAAIRAGYSKRTAKSQGQRLLTFVDIQKRIQALQKDTQQKVNISKDQILMKLVSILETNFTDFFEGQKLKPFNELTPTQALAVESFRVTPNGINYKLASKLGAIDRLNRMLGYEAPQKLLMEIDNWSDEMIDEFLLRKLENYDKRHHK
ncbi:terminase small subunit [Maribellus comscasis]|uniref:Terminase small subunit n=1 Tax=Maribellus comscasis TaxID=2681766 RepID=A0A6I6JVP6_9BACT|nr:terminase small subunit [Maribellus comscasis]QGY44147.1 terminase small subunit [Maribellus comscasis]